MTGLTGTVMVCFSSTLYRYDHESTPSYGYTSLGWMPEKVRAFISNPSSDETEDAKRTPSSSPHGGNACQSSTFPISSGFSIL
ncbi:predicted protein [Plenodomus lingam JN3]|uniref:Predicted protein n=1 Tax=Leptosphaeria maculans (strain JN3 / isolate v23.1.3 / race Av1-4-5-6-7-8) TaxID=985895 RepID=E5AAK6_LEPMJ|nr:predicted protein [Plenodomus lingam JN3]CBY00697.1 predicted protein [Plenodomus lingam JN3]